MSGGVGWMPLGRGHKGRGVLENRVNQTNVRSCRQDSPETVPKGLNVDAEYIISVRKKS